MAEPRHNLILVEGLPGTGKTTRAQEIAADLQAKGQPVHLYLEGDLHPVDMQWISRLPPESYDLAVSALHKAWRSSPQSESWESIENRLNRLSEAEAGSIHTAYTKLDFRDHELWNTLDTFRNSEIHDARVSYPEYREIYLRRWQNFAAIASVNPGTYIFECAYFQSHITEMLGHHLVDDAEIIACLAELVEPVRFLNPQVQYIQTADYTSRIRETAASRGDWLDSVISWVESSPYGAKHGLAGFDGMLRFFERRRQIEEHAMQVLRLPVLLIDRQTD